jgi:hypothetical protein
LAQAERYAELPTGISISFRRQFEVKGWDVVLRCDVDDAAAQTGARSDWEIEIKPSLADEFPAVLRQIKARGHKGEVSDKAVLVIERFDAAGASLKQVRQMFGCPIITIAEIEAAMPEEDDDGIGRAPDDLPTRWVPPVEDDEDQEPIPF